MATKKIKSVVKKGWMIVLAHNPHKFPDDEINFYPNIWDAVQECGDLNYHLGTIGWDYTYEVKKVKVTVEFVK